VSRRSSLRRTFAASAGKDACGTCRVVRRFVAPSPQVQARMPAVRVASFVAPSHLRCSCRQGCLRYVSRRSSLRRTFAAVAGKDACGTCRVVRRSVAPSPQVQARMPAVRVASFVAPSHLRRKCRQGCLRYGSGPSSLRRFLTHSPLRGARARTGTRRPTRPRAPRRPVRNHPPGCAAPAGFRSPAGSVA